jgi:hypothetical protein
MLLLRFFCCCRIPADAMVLLLLLAILLFSVAGHPFACSPLLELEICGGFILMA